MAWTLLYDGECGFCTWTAAAILRADRGEKLLVRTIQSDVGQAMLASIPAERRLDSVHLVDPDGRRYSGGAALPPLLKLLPGGAVPALALRQAPGLTQRGYEFVAGHRSQLGRLMLPGARGRARRRLGDCGCGDVPR